MTPNKDILVNVVPTPLNAAVKKWIKPEKITYVQAGDFEKKTDKPDANQTR